MTGDIMPAAIVGEVGRRDYPIRREAALDLEARLGPAACAAFDNDNPIEDLGDLAARVVALVDQWLCAASTEEELAATILRARPGDTDYAAALAQVREVIAAVSAALGEQIGPMEW